jgi:hypothetical protein
MADIPKLTSTSPFFLPYTFIFAPELRESRIVIDKFL